MDIWTVPHFGHCEESIGTCTCDPDDILKMTLMMGSLLGCTSGFGNYISGVSFPVLVTGKPRRWHQ